MSESLTSRWITLHLTDLDRLIAAKRQVHQALQIVSAVGRNLLPHHPWDIFGNLEWRSDTRMWLGWSIPGRFECRSGLSPADLSLHLCTPQGNSFAKFPLHGKTYAEGFAWMQNSIQEFGIDSSAMKTDLPYDIPSYPQAGGAAFDVSDTAAFAEIAHTFRNAQSTLDVIASRFDLWQQVRTWPHHFDISSRRRFAKGDGFWHMGVGYGPGGDHNYQEPYYHLTCYPADEVDKDHLPDLPGDLRWHKEKWLGVVLLWSDIVKLEDAEAQGRAVEEWFTTGMAALETAKQ